jgi:hypothetical protein
LAKGFLLFCFIVSAFIVCDARRDCYDNAETVRIRGNFCELLAIANYNFDKQRGQQTPQDDVAKNLLVCYKQEQDRKECDSKSEWWPLPTNQLNHPSGNENILSTSPDKINE